jgi:hypothetical protein
MLTSGYGVIQQQIEKQKSRGNFVRLNSIFWRDKDRRIIRHLHDDPVTILTHDFVKCADNTEKSFTCRKSLVELTEGGLKPLEYPCPLCLVEVTDDKGTHLLKPRTVAWGLAIERQVSKNIGGQRVLVDMMEEVEIQVGKDETKKVTIPKIGVIGQSLTNFWNQFANFYVRYNTTLDRDYEVVRDGGGRGRGAPAYTMIPEDPIDGLRTVNEVQEKYKESLQGKSPHELLRDRINFFGSYAYMSKHLDPSILTRVEWPDVSEPIEVKEESLDDHPGGLDEFAPRTKDDEEEMSFDSLRSQLTHMANRRPKGNDVE